VILFWDQQRYKRTAYLVPETSNVGVIRSAHNPTAYAKTYAKMVKEGCILAMPSVINTVNNLTDTIQADNEDVFDAGVKADTKLTQLAVEVDDPQQDYPVQEGTFDSVQQEWLYWHHKLGHLPKGRMTQLAKEGGIPQRLAKITVPLCAACIHGKQTKTPWRTKEEPKKAPKVATYPGECIAVDQLESRIPGFVAQLKAPRLTKHRYHYATVFVDHYSDFTYIHFHMIMAIFRTWLSNRNVSKRARGLHTVV
jgi:hypothetical protein